MSSTRRGRRARRRRDSDSDSDDDAYTAGGYGGGASRAGGNPFGGRQDQALAKDNRSNTEVLANVLAIASETTQIGATTLDKLEQNTEQMHRIDNDLNAINQNLNKVERSIANMKSITTAIVNTWRKPKAEEDRRFKGTRPTDFDGDKDQTKKANEQPYVHISIPDGVQWGDALADGKIQQRLSHPDKVPLATGEELLYFYANSKRASFLVSDETDNCIVLTSARVVKISDGKKQLEVTYDDLRTVTHKRTGMMSSDRIVFTMRDDGREESISVHKAATVDFFVKSIQVCIEQAEINRIEASKSAERKEEDDQLDAISGLMDTMALQASAMNRELRYQNQFLDHLNEQTKSTQTRINRNNRNMKKLL